MICVVQGTEKSSQRKENRLNLRKIFTGVTKIKNYKKSLLNVTKMLQKIVDLQYLEFLNSILKLHMSYEKK